MLPRDWEQVYDHTIYYLAKDKQAAEIYWILGSSVLAERAREPLWMPWN